VGLELRDRIGVLRILWESDFPHVESQWPNSQQVMKRLTRGMSDHEIDLVTNANARRLYNWPKREAQPGAA
jgi:predicted TIM-barrel fold metal-dependent hydrolase